MTNARHEGGRPGQAQAGRACFQDTADASLPSPPPGSTASADLADAPRPVARLWREALASSKRESGARRTRVLAHEDLAERLADAPLSLSHPGRWSGWIPPRRMPEECCTHCEKANNPRPACRGLPHRARANDSPTRRQLVDIAAEAYARDESAR